MFQRTNIFPKLTVLENVRAALLTHRGQGPNFWARANRLCRGEAEALLASIGLAGQGMPSLPSRSRTNGMEIPVGLFVPKRFQL